jgi:6-phosphogluconolactonase
MAAQTWLNLVAILPTNIYNIPAELGAHKAAQRYEPLVRQALPFDLVLLGLGNDGHTASLFSNTMTQGESLVQPVFHAPKSPKERVTLSATALSQSREILVLVSGPEKKATLGAWQRGEPLPIRTLQPTGTLTVIYDRKADPGILV